MSDSALIETSSEAVPPDAGYTTQDDENRWQDETRKSTVGTRRDSGVLEGVRERLSLACRGLTQLPQSVPEVVTFEVGGRAFSVRRCVLARDPQSLLFALAVEHFSHDGGAARKRRRAEQRCDSEGWNAPAECRNAIRIPGKSPEVFEKLVNFLRGYKNAIPREWRSVCEEEAVYYGIEKSWSECYQRRRKPFFRSYEELCLDESMLTVGYRCATVGEEMERGEHLLRLSFTGEVGVGVVCGERGMPDDSSMVVLKYGMFYCMDGKVRTCSDAEPLQRLPVPDRSSEKTYEMCVMFDAEECIVRWDCASPKGVVCVGLQRAPKGQKYHFGLWASPNSRVLLKS